MTDEKYNEAQRRILREIERRGLREYESLSFLQKLKWGFNKKKYVENIRQVFKDIKALLKFGEKAQCSVSERYRNKVNTKAISDCPTKDDWHKQDTDDIYDLISEDWSVRYFVCIMKDKSRVTAMGNCDEDYDGGVSVNLFFDHEDEKYYASDIIWWKEIHLPKEIE